MDFAGVLESFAKFQRAGMPIHNDGDGWAQPITITQPFFETGIKFIQIINHIPNRNTLYSKRPFPIRKIAQQRGNPNDWQKVILLPY
jgi:hypothetical protein